jgi:hypothetical protein
MLKMLKGLKNQQANIKKDKEAGKEIAVSDSLLHGYPLTNAARRGVIPHIPVDSFLVCVLLNICMKSL